jgi:hypothetical protein
VTLQRTLAPLSRMTVRLDDLPGLEWTEVSTRVTSTDGVAIVVERTMRWDATGYGAHTEKATAGAAAEWYFAEGSQGFFSTYLLLVNPHATANVAHVTWLREGESALQRDYALPPASRVTINAGTEPDLVNRSFGARVLFDQPGAAERAMYFGVSPLWSGGHASAGATAPSTHWLLAEGATGSYFATFVLIANPNDVAADLALTYLPLTGSPVTTTKRLEARQRMTINIAQEDPSLESAAVSTDVVSTTPVVVERAQYWPNPSWYEAHNSFGVTAPATRWALAEGRVGGPSAAQTYILLANAGTEDAGVTITFLRETGAPIVKTGTALQYYPAWSACWLGHGSQWITRDCDRGEVPCLEHRDLRPRVGIVGRQVPRRDCTRNRRENRFRFHPVPRLVVGGPAAHGRSIVRTHCNLQSGEASQRIEVSL